MVRFALTSWLVMLVACSEDTQVADGALCACQAVGVAFDKASSTLGATNVQDAIDELAARPLPEPSVGKRIETVVRTLANPGTKGAVSQTADCPDPAHDIALGGACSFVDGATIAGTSITNDSTHASYLCGWLQPGGSSTNMAITVTCLRQAK